MLATVTSAGKTTLFGLNQLKHHDRQCNMYSKLATTRGVKSEREKERGEMREYYRSGRGELRR